MKLMAILAVFVMFVVAAAGCGRTKKDDEETQAREAEAREAADAEEAAHETEDTGSAVEETEGEAGAEAESEETTASDEEPEVELEEITLTEANDGEEIELALGQVLVVTLASDQTSGLQWEVAPFVDPVVKRVGKREYTPSEPEGTGGTTTLRFEAVTAGSSPLHMVYQRPGERNPQIKKKFSVRLVVR